MTTAELLTGFREQLTEAQQLCPELRFGQMIAIVGELAADETGHSLWDVEDAEFAAALDRFVGDLRRRSSISNQDNAAP